MKMKPANLIFTWTVRNSLRPIPQNPATWNPRLLWGLFWRIIFFSDGRRWSADHFLTKRCVANFRLQFLPSRKSGIGRPIPDCKWSANEVWNLGPDLGLVWCRFVLGLPTDNPVISFRLANRNRTDNNFSFFLFYFLFFIPTNRARLA